MDLGVTVLPSLGSGHVDNLTGPSLDHDVTVLPEGGTLEANGLAQLELVQAIYSRVGLGSTGTGSLESLVVLVVGHF